MRKIQVSMRPVPDLGAPMETGLTKPVPIPRALVRAVTAMVTHEDGVAVHHDEGDIIEVYEDHVDELVALGAAVRIQNALPENAG